MEWEPREKAAGLLLLYIAERSNGSICHTTQQLMLRIIWNAPYPPRPAKSGVVEHGQRVDEGTTPGSIASGGANRKGGDPRGQRVLDPGSYDDML